MQNFQAAKERKICKLKQGEYEKTNAKQSNNSRNRWEDRENQVTETRVSTEKRKEVTGKIWRKRFKLEFAVF